MNVLAIETSSDCGTIALQLGTDVLTDEIIGVREQSARLMPLIDGAIARAGIALSALDAIAFGAGPGSFTGVRLAASVSQGLAMAADLGVIAVSSLAALAQQVERREQLACALVCVDARMGEVYWADYRIADGLAAVAGRERLTLPAAVETPRVAAWAAVGSGFARYAPVLGAQAALAAVARPDWQPAAVDLLPAARRALARGELVGPERASPSYLRGQAAWDTLD